MLNMLKASLGIDAAKVDTVLESLSVVRGGIRGDQYASFTLNRAVRADEVEAMVGKILSI